MAQPSKFKLNKMYVCEECVVVFQVFGKIQRKYVYCPSCGDCDNVTRYGADRTTKKVEGEKIPKIRWTPQELELLQQTKDKKLQPHQVAIMTGRSINSVMKKLGRV